VRRLHRRLGLLWRQRQLLHHVQPRQLLAGCLLPCLPSLPPGARNVSIAIGVAHRHLCRIAECFEMLTRSARRLESSGVCVCAAAALATQCTRSSSTRALVHLTAFTKSAGPGLTRLNSSLTTLVPCCRSNLPPSSASGDLSCHDEAESLCRLHISLAGTWLCMRLQVPDIGRNWCRGRTHPAGGLHTAATASKVCCRICVLHARPGQSLSVLCAAVDSMVLGVNHAAAALCTQLPAAQSLQSGPATICPVIFRPSGLKKQAHASRPSSAGTYGPGEGGQLCLMCPANFTTLADGSTDCDTPVRP